MNKKVLIIDDESFMRTLLRRTLEELEEQGVEMFAAEDGKRGLELAFQEHPNLIILDLMMPGVDGYQVCRRVKARYKDVYIMLLTAKGSLIDRLLGMRVGADEYITKPFDPDLIIKRIAAILGLDN